ncbi:MAG: putative crotonobetaine/carnitine-CoA ligase [Actinomycetia bacterium]|nr:putative crotonobetaine/carnitine-CoA ligase [Actinomycetes bacterium]
MSAITRATFADRWRRAVDAVPQQQFLVWEDREGVVSAWKYAEFDALVERVAGMLSSQGVVHGAKVHAVLANSPAFVALWLATARLGAVLVPCDPQSTAVEIRRQMERTRPAVGVCGAERAEVYREGACGSCVVIVVDEDDAVLAGLAPDDIAPAPAVEVAPHDAAAIMFTSGTTSEPKGVVVTQANYAFAGDVMAAAASLDRSHRQYVVLPLFHANAQYYSFASAISVGATVVLMPRFSATGYLEAGARHSVTHGSLFAAPMRMILAHDPPAIPGFAFRHLWYAQNITNDQYEDLSRRFGCRPRQLYGMTETIPAVLTNPALGSQPAAMGIPTLGCRVELRVPESDDPVPDGEAGEVVVGGERGTTLFAGYFEDEATTEDAFRAGWFRTGDLARIDADGGFRFEGRRGDILKVAGENVSVVEVEAVLAEHPSVLEAAVVGAPDPIRDEVPIAFVVAAPGATVDVDELMEHCARHLVPSKRPRRIDVVDELPRTSVGKIRKFMLTAAAARS